MHYTTVALAIAVGLTCFAPLGVALPHKYRHSPADHAHETTVPTRHSAKGRHKALEIDTNLRGLSKALQPKASKNQKPGQVTPHKLKRKPVQEMKTKVSEHKTPAANPYRGMNYIPNNNVVICSCAKCGSTSLLQFVYQSVLGHNWTYQGAPYLQEVWSDRWEQTFDVVTDIAKQRKVMHDPETFSFALVREPKDRVLSAWSSKIACDQGWKLTADIEDRAALVPRLLALQGKGRTADCLELHDFLVVLDDIRRANKTHLLNDHFRPQTHDCFEDFPPDQWSKVVEIGAPDSFSGLAKALGNKGSAEPPHSHTSSHGFYSMSSDDARLLEEITAEERKMIGPYLRTAQAKASPKSQTKKSLFLEEVESFFHR